jgi:FKBP-type peptidyl-prolyl cis-trans isomerase
MAKLTNGLDRFDSSLDRGKEFVVPVGVGMVIRGTLKRIGVRCRILIPL